MLSTFEGEDILLDIAFSVYEGNLAATLLVKLYLAWLVRQTLLSYINGSFLKLCALLKRMTLQDINAFFG